MKIVKKAYNTTKKAEHTVIRELPLDEKFSANLSHETQVPKYIVIHEVSLGKTRTPADYDMTHYANKILVDGLEGRTIGYHYLCGDDSVYHFVPDNMQAHHTGTNYFNANSIGLERLVCEGISYEDALHNQAKLTATLMVKYNIPLENVITHQETKRRTFSPDKPCPGRMLDGQYGGLKAFYQEVLWCLDNNDLFNGLLTEKRIYEKDINQFEAMGTELPEKDLATSRMCRLMRHFITLFII